MNPASTQPRTRRLTLLAWLLVAFAALPFALRVNETLNATTRLEGSESSRVQAALRDQFKSPFTKIALLRIAQAPDPRTAGRPSRSDANIGRRSSNTGRPRSDVLS
jgi:hypothetical protein